MKFNKKKILLLLISSIFLFCCNQGVARADSIEAFKKQDVKTQALFINSLSKPEKFSFLQKFLPGSCFVVSPWVKTEFLSNGRALNFDPELGLYFYTRWSIINNVFKIWKQKPSDPYPDEKEYILVDFTARDSVGNQIGLWLTFTDSKNEIYGFKYYPECNKFKEGDYDYDRFMKSLKQKK